MNDDHVETGLNVDDPNSTQEAPGEVQTTNSGSGSGGSTGGGPSGGPTPFKA